MDQRSVRKLLHFVVPHEPILGVEDGQRFVMDEAACTRNTGVDVDIRILFVLMRYPFHAMRETDLRLTKEKVTIDLETKFSRDSEERRARR